MIFDSSVLVAILRVGRFERLADLLPTSPERLRISSASYFETGIALDRNRDPGLSLKLNAMIEALDIEIVPVSA